MIKNDQAPGSMIKYEGPTRDSSVIDIEKSLTDKLSETSIDPALVDDWVFLQELEEF